MSATDFAAFVLDAGLRPRGPIVPDGRWHRCPTDDHPHRRNGAWKLAIDGRIGWVQNWARESAPRTWRPDRVEAAPLLDYRAIRRRNEADATRRLKAISAALAYYQGAKPVWGGHPYLEAHGLDMTGCRGLKVDADGWLVVPMGRERRLQSVQRISAEGEKRFWTGAPTSGAYYRIERPAATLTILCEGLATGLALYAAVPTSRVVVAFSAANLPRVARTLSRDGMAVVAADNDHQTAERTGTNPGVVYAEEAARILGCEVAVPECVGTDFCDLRQELREEARARAWTRRAEAAVDREVDARLAREILRAARFLPLAALAR